MSNECVFFEEIDEDFEVEFDDFVEISDAGYERGFEDGKIKGYEQGKTEGYENGKADGYEEGQTTANALTASIINRTVTSVPKEVLEGVTSIPSSFFNGCTNLVNIELTEDITQIGQSAFANCTSLEHIELSENVKILGSHVFSSAGLKTITFNKNLEEIGLSAFYQMPNLIKLDFSPCVNLKHITNSICHTCYALEELILPPNLETIKGGILVNNSKVSTLYFPSTVKSIDSSILTQAFGKPTLYIKATTPPTLTGKFTVAITKIVVPQGCADTYKSETNWSVYAGVIIEGDF